jgi:uncharacterized membrane protein
MAIPRWAIAVIVIIGLCIIGIIAMAAAGIYFVTQQVQITEASPASAERLFDEGRSRFKGAQPLIELDSDGEIVQSHLTEARRARPASDASLEALHILAWDADDEKVVQLEIPFWLLRMKSGPLDVFSETAGLRRADLRLTVRDLEELGPSLLIDHRGRRGDRVLVWTQ